MNTEMTSGFEELLNQIIWMNSSKDIVDTMISMGAAFVIGVILLGIVQCFFGYPVFRYELALVGAVGAGAATYLGLYFFFHYTGVKLILWTLFAAFMGGGMLFAVSAILVFLVVMVGSSMAFLVASTSNGWEMLPQVIVIASVAIALVAGIFYRHVIIIGNAVLGAGIIGIIISGLFDSASFGWLVGGIFAVLGLITQYWMYIAGRRKQKAKEEKQEAKEMAKKTKVISNEIPDVADAQSTNLSSIYPSQDDLFKNSSGTLNPVKEETLKKAQDSSAKAEEALEKRVLKEEGFRKEPTSVNPMLAARTSSLKPKPKQEPAIKPDVSRMDKPQEETAQPKPLEQASISETGTISLGEIKGKMKRI